MMLKTLTKTLYKQNLIFTNLRALFWESEKALIISDLHIGKSAHFRKHGIAVSSEILETDLVQLEYLIHHFNARKVIIVGDMFHAGYNSDLDIFKKWRDRLQAAFILVKGNHDRLRPAVYSDLNIEMYNDYLDIGPFRFEHEPQKRGDNLITISGHIHPGVVLTQKRFQRLRLPCFAYSATQMILPAFSKFTGLDCGTVHSTFNKVAFSQEIIMEIII